MKGNNWWLSSLSRSPYNECYNFCAQQKFYGTIKIIIITNGKTNQIRNITFTLYPRCFAWNRIKCCCVLKSFLMIGKKKIHVGNNVLLKIFVWIEKQSLLILLQILLANCSFFLPLSRYWCNRDDTCVLMRQMMMMLMVMMIWMES